VSKNKENKTTKDSEAIGVDTFVSLFAVTCDNAEGTISGKQHIYKPFKQTWEYTDEVYTGNKSLCGRYSILDGDECNMEFEKVKEYHESEALNTCKNCLRSWQAN